MAAALTVAVLVEVALQVRQRGADAIALADQALAAGDGVTAIGRARDAAMAVAPWSPYPEQGYARLQAIADGAETRGDFDQAALAWRAVWTSIRATRREKDEALRLQASGRALVRLATRACEGSQTRPPAACAATTEAALTHDDLPALPAFTWLGLGAVAFFVGGAGAATAEGARRRIGWGALTLLGVGLAVFALARG